MVGGRRRRLVLELLALAAVLLLAACTSQSEETGVAGPPAGETKSTFVIGYDTYWLGNSWSVQLAAEFRASVSRHGAQIERVVYTQSDNDAQKQISNVDSMISRKVDAIIMTPVSPQAAVPIIKKANAARIPVILLGADANTDTYTSLVTVDDTAIGRVGAQWLVDRLGGKGRIYVLDGVAGNPVNEQRRAGAREVFARYPGIRVVASAAANWDQAEAKRAVTSMLAAHPQVDGVWSQGGAMTLGAIEAFRADGHPLVPMTGEGNNGLLKVWQQLGPESGFDAIGVSKPTWLADDALKVTLRVLTGQPYQKNDRKEPPAVTADNLPSLVQPDLPDDFWVDTRLDPAQIRSMFNG
ncbi:ABC transporter substrate-binding protein [Actinophytocola gossypii]|uniref:ABC transporter substrate-binding protein n=1 Tax=Actinophytocola gossypii TaxID=2812003 RepID=A0ABT2J366_9PSEU|nr:ABC transporter substrate-binding protein [Actinophytocola gossypii]MCT2582298.1 ABC transporter substrate-binding protein [Actinophytocola gossypii]